MITRLLALGGHEFASRPSDRAVCELLLRLATTRAEGRPRICILPTAGGDTSEQTSRFYAAFAERPCEPSDLSLFRLGRRESRTRTLRTEKELLRVLPSAELSKVLKALEGAAILHAEEHQGSRYFELGHDWLAEKVFERKKERETRLNASPAFAFTVSKPITRRS